MLKNTAEKYRTLKDQYEEASKRKETIGRDLDECKDQLINEMLAAGLTTMRIEGTGLFNVTNKVAAKIVNRESFFEWLYRTDRADIIRHDVNFQTLQAWVNELPQDDLAEAHRHGLDLEERATLSLRR